jgi:23S rRNA pseudouridine2605 synthase
MPHTESPSQQPEGAVTGPQRLQKVLAAAGVGSRRVCENLIEAGRVKVDGHGARLGDKVDPETAVIYVDGERVIVGGNLVYIAMNKPRGVVSTMADERGRVAISDFLGQLPQRVFHVGRLDADSEGLLLLTNDGTLAHQLTHPSFGVTKTYLCEVRGSVPKGLGRRLRDGVELEDGLAKVDSFRVVDSVGSGTLIELVLHEGRKHIVRRLLEECGHPVLRLVRTAVGQVKLGDLRPGRTRRLTNPEIASLFSTAEQPKPAEPERGSAGRTPVGGRTPVRGRTPIGGLKPDGGRIWSGRARGTGSQAESRRQQR